MSLTAKAFAVYEPNGKFQVYDLNRRPLSAHDVAIRILYCGICHTDIHQVKDEWHNAKFPMVPGHEITGIVQQVGSAVKDFKLGDRVGVGCMVDSCRACPPCKRDLENHCVQGFSGTYNSTEQDKVTPTYGGYANFIVVNDHFVVQIPKDLPMDSAAPLLCAGITTYSPMIQHNVGKNTKVGVVGLGGLGHMAVKFGVALKADVTVISTSESKRNDAMRLGAKHFIVSKDEEQMKAAANSFDFIINAVSANHDIMPIVNLLAFEGVLCMIGAPAQPLQISAINLLMKRPKITGSLIGGMKETQEMLNFCAKHSVKCEIELLQATPQNLAIAYERTLASDVKYRFVLDMENAFK